MSREQYTEYHNNGTLFDTKFHEECLIKPVSTDTRPNEEQHTLKRMEKEFQHLLEDCVEDALIHEKDVEPYSHMVKPFDFLERIQENKLYKTEEDKK